MKKQKIQGMVFHKHKITLIDDKITVDGYLMNLDLYRCDIEVAFGQTKKVHKWHDDGEPDGLVHTDNDNCYFLWVKNKKMLPELVHEVYHLVNNISRRCGLSQDGSNEQQAHLMHWLFDEIRKLK